MLKNPKAAIWLVLGAIIFAIGFLIYVWTATPSSGQSKVSFNPVQPTPPQIKGENFFDSPLFPAEDPNASGEPTSSGPAQDFLGPVLEKIGRSLSSLSAKTSSVSLSPANAQIILTEKDIFEFGYDTGYRSFLLELSQGMTQAGFLSTGAAVSVSNMADAVKIQDAFADYLTSLAQTSASGGISEETVVRYRYTYRELLPKLWREELLAKKKAEQISFLPAKLWYTYRTEQMHKQIAKVSMLDTIKNAFVPTANAAFAYSTTPYCYREGIPNLIRGSQRAAPFCNSGLRCSPYCVFIYDCGIAGEH